MVIVNRPTLELDSLEKATLRNFATVLDSFCSKQNGCALCPFNELVTGEEPCIINGSLDNLLNFLKVTD